MDCKDTNLRREAMETALRNQHQYLPVPERAEQLVKDAQVIFKYLKCGTLPEGGEEDGKQ